MDPLAMATGMTRDTTVSADSGIAALIYVDLERDLLGLRSRCAEPWPGGSVLAGTLDRLARVEPPCRRVVFCPAAQQESVAALVGDRDVDVVPLAQPPGPNAVLPRRKWALTSWRGGLGEATVFDEHVYTAEMIEHLRRGGIDTVMVVPATAVALDPSQASALLAHHRQHGDEMRFTFCLAAPGLVPPVYRLDLLADVVATGIPIGQALRYDPDNPAADYINQECTYSAPPAYCRSRFRYLCDTERSRRRLEAAWAAHPLRNGTSTDLVAAVEESLAEPDPLPAEIEIEITTAPSLRVVGYPQRRPPQRGPMRVAQFEKIVADCAAFDDIRLTLGGCGEPLAHPDLLAIVAAAHAAGIFAINIETDGRALTDDLADDLLDSPADTLSVWLDADTPAGYRAAKDADGFEAVLAQLERYADKRSRQGRGPLLVPHLVKTRATLGEMEGFYDRWLRRCGQAVITGYNAYAGQVEDRAVMDMAPPSRGPCGRLDQLMVILADGNVTPCPQDFRANTVLGNAFHESLSDIWLGAAATDLRVAHRRGQWNRNERCAACKEWHRW